MAKRGYNVKLVERRPDPRKDKEEGGRSINLALSDRGLLGLSLLEKTDEIMNLVLPMKGRLIHTGEADSLKTELQPYSGRDGEVINSVSRAGLNRLMLRSCEDYDNIEMKFSMKCLEADVKNAKAKFLNEETGKESWEEADMMIGTDGAYSSIRLSMQLGGVNRFNFSQNYLQHGYKEIEMRPFSGGGHRIENDALHIWPRHGFMMIALPNLDGSFTCTLFMPYKTDVGFDSLDTKEKVNAFGHKYFPDAMKLIPDFAEQYFENPTGPLATMRCYPWHYEGKTVIMGDAAHAIVPFYGQGMNASFEDVYYFDQLMTKYSGDSEKAFPAFSKMRKKNADAIAKLANQNYKEMRASTANPLFKQKRELEIELEKNYPEFSSKYNLVTFREDVGYATALKMGELQDNFFLSAIEKNGGTHDGLPRTQLMEAVKRLWEGER
ncbi:MAG: NAD(P)/FAD-dependent oxidoreductase [Candidatus Kapaibacteriales bacterium]